MIDQHVRFRENEGVYYWQSATGLQEGDLAQMAAALGHKPACWLLDGRRVSLFKVDLPRRNRKEAVKALPFILEEQVASDIDSLDFFIVEESANGQALVAVVDKQWYGERLAELQVAGIRLIAVVPEMLAVPPPLAGLKILLGDDCAYLRTPDMGWCFDLALAPKMVHTVQTDGTDQLELLQPLDSEAVAAQFLPVDSWDICRLEVSPRAALFEVIDGTPPSLLRASGTMSKPEQQRNWFIAAALALSLSIGVVLAGLFFNNLRLSAESGRLQSEIGTTFRDAFPEVQRLVNPRLQALTQIERLQAQGSAGGQFLDLFAITGKAIQEDAKTPVRIEQIRYSENLLDLTLVTEDIAVLEALQQRLSGMQITSRILSARAQEDDGLIGRLQISEALP